MRGETVEEIAAAAQVMRDKALRIEAPGGRRRHRSGPAETPRAPTMCRPPAPLWSPPPACRWPSTAIARYRSKSGAADVLTALGINIDCDMALVRAALWEVGICF